MFVVISEASSICIKEKRKKSSFFNGPTTKRGGVSKGWTTKTKRKKKLR